MTIFIRLKSERERLGLTQPALAVLADVGKTTVINWEKGSSAPDAVQLAALAQAGADVIYILTGIDSGAFARLSAKQKRLTSSAVNGDGYLAAVEKERMLNAHTRRHAVLLAQFDKANEEGKQAIEATAKLAAK